MVFWAILGVLFVIFGLVLNAHQKKITGMAGEYWVKEELEKLPSDYLVLNDVMVKAGDRTSQIDHVVVSKYGIFVIETKQYNATIYGNDYDNKWKLDYGNKKYYTQNPVHQNYGHVQALKEALDLDEKVFIPIVCISSQARIRVKSKQVVPIYKLIRKIRVYNHEVLPEYEDIYKTIDFFNMTSKDTRESHVDRVKEIKAEKERKKMEILEKKTIERIEKVNNNICPECGGKLVECNGKYSKFLGCSNYPRCRYTKHIK